MPGVELNGGNMAILPPMDELTASVHINVAEIPDHVRDDLAATVLDFIVRLKKDGLLPK